MQISTPVIAALAGFLAGAFGSSDGNSLRPRHRRRETFECKNYVLMDGAGHKRGEWKIDSSGEPVLRMFDAQGRVIWQTNKAGRAVDSPALTGRLVLTWISAFDIALQYARSSPRAR